MVKLEFILIISATILKIFVVKKILTGCELVRGIKSHLRKGQHYRDNSLTSSAVRK